LPVGGLKEKIVAAHTAGLQRVIVPKANNRELDRDVPVDVKESLDIFTVSDLLDVLLLSFDPLSNSNTPRSFNDQQALLNGHFYTSIPDFGGIMMYKIYARRIK